MAIPRINKKSQNQAMFFNFLWKHTIAPKKTSTIKLNTLETFFPFSNAQNLLRHVRSP